MGSEKIRNVVLVGHSGSGKTALAEALLFAAGVTTRMGRIEDGNTVTDFEPEERDRRSSVSLAMAPLTWDDHKVNVIDTPGVSDFIGEVRAALRVADLALFVVSAVDGVEVQTEHIWKLAEEEGIARAVFINKLDRERASFSRTLQGGVRDPDRADPRADRIRARPLRGRQPGGGTRLLVPGWRDEVGGGRPPRGDARRGGGSPYRAGRGGGRDR